MPTRIYANLAPMGWVDLTAEPGTVIGEHRSDPYTWWEESAVMYAPRVRPHEDTVYEFPYVMIGYKGKDYRVSPYLIQVVVD